jgi:glycosyltransferase involved in cell wall biosynthesis
LRAITTAANDGCEALSIEYGAVLSRMPVTKRRLLILSEIISPYRIPVFNALSQNEGVDLRVVFLAETDAQLRQWRVYKDELCFSYEVLPSWRFRFAGKTILLNRRVQAALERFAPDAIICGGYNYYASWEALSWSRRNQVDFVLWSESNPYDARSGRRWVESLKSHFVARCDRFVVPGKSSLAYLQLLGVAPEKVFTAPDAVDNDWFESEANAARARAAEIRKRLGLPGRFILFVGRLVPEKGIFDLLEAYGRLKDDVRSGVGLVFAGDGDGRLELERRAKKISPGAIWINGFLQREELGAMYGLADVFVLPTHSDPWGLVVNEAMACGLPVVVTDVAGCAADLVENGWNGFSVPQGGPERLSRAMDAILQDAQLRQKMSAHSLERIRQYSPRACAAGLAAAAFPPGGLAR